MRKITLVAWGVVALAIATLPPAAVAQSEMVDGLVTKVDPSAGKITVRHGPLKKYDMDDGHTMVFRANDPAMLKAVKAGDKVKFEPDRVNGQFTIMKIQKVK
jgi:Cu(I)/Ag(I) efflux system periplasmic protein CusF